MRTITCSGDRRSGTFLIIASVGLSDEDNSVSPTDNFVNVNVFNSVTSPRVLSYRCDLYYFLTMPLICVIFAKSNGLKVLRVFTVHMKTGK